MRKNSVAALEFEAARESKLRSKEAVSEARSLTRSSRTAALSAEDEEQTERPKRCRLANIDRQISKAKTARILLCVVLV